MFFSYIYAYICKIIMAVSIFVFFIPFEANYLHTWIKKQKSKQKLSRWISSVSLAD
jgi:hypothetical protein